MNLGQHKFLRTLIAGTIFWMALLLTPRAWIYEAETTDRADQDILIQQLDGTDDCLWCTPEQATQPVDCEDSDQARPWLHPDDPPPAPNAAPCLEDGPDSPSA